MSDPYKTLGIAPGATDEEIKKAYKALAKKYHPDLNKNNPKAADMMQEINAAYDELINHKGSSSYGSSSSSSYGGGYHQNYYNQGWNQSYGPGSSSNHSQSQYESQETQLHMMEAVKKINAKRFWEALNELNKVPYGERSARWFYLSSIAKNYTGDSIGAKSDIYEALRRDPSNAQYQDFRDRLERVNTNYTQYRTTNYGKGIGTGLMSCCLPTILANLCCYFCC